ncbi:MAG: hypothetical protein NVSMB65_13550 [Chloroflexota bacterium]
MHPVVALATSGLTHLLGTYGYWAVLLFVLIESTGIPFPGETMLLAAAIYAGTTHHLHISLVIAAAAAGAILGDNLGYWVGREAGYRLLRRYGRYIRLEERRLKLGQYLFRKHGGKVVFFGRFVAVLRTWAAFLAGANQMPWRRFLVFNATGGVLWATLYGLGGFTLGKEIHRLSGTVRTVTIAVGLLALVAFVLFLRRNEERLEEEAERALPGPLDDYQPGGIHGPLRAESAGHADRARTGPPGSEDPHATISPFPDSSSSGRGDRATPGVTIADGQASPTRYRAKG